jgi:hypothetical protein
MRKYRNGKQSREPRQLSKYSPEYIQYRGSRGGYSVKVGLCDITGDGDADTISVAWRNPANGKVENCTVIIPSAQIPANGPSSLTATEAIPANGPSTLTATEAVPANGPSSLAASEQVPVSGPSSLAASEQIAVPNSGPSNLSASTYITFGPAAGNLTSGYTDSANREWFLEYATGGYTINVSTTGTAVLNKPDGTMETLSDSSNPLPGTTGNWTIATIFNYDYLGDGGNYVATFNLIST